MFPCYQQNFPCIPLFPKSFFSGLVFPVPWDIANTAFCSIGWALAGNRKRKKMPNLWPKKSGRGPLRNLGSGHLQKSFLKQYLSEKQNGYLQSGRLQEVVA